MPNLAAAECAENGSSFARWILSATALLLDAMVIDGEDKLTQLRTVGTQLYSASKSNAGSPIENAMVNNLQRMMEIMMAEEMAK